MYESRILIRNPFYVGSLPVCTQVCQVHHVFTSERANLHSRQTDTKKLKVEQMFFLGFGLPFCCPTTSYIFVSFQWLNNLIDCHFDEKFWVSVSWRHWNCKSLWKKVSSWAIVDSIFVFNQNEPFWCHRKNSACERLNYLIVLVSLDF